MTFTTRPRMRLTGSLAALACFSFALTAQAALTVGEWKPVFKGIELSISSNIPTADSEILRRQVAYALRVDLTDPDLEFFTTPQFTNYVAGDDEVAGYTPTDFLVRNDLQVVLNANYFNPGTYYLPGGTPMNIRGLAVNQGTIVSITDSPTYAATITFDENNYPTMIPSDWPAASTDGVYTAVAGNDPVLVAGTNVGPKDDVDPRTVFGLSEDRRYLFLVSIDGRQPGYSDGADLFECGLWLLALGAHDGINMDGGGSTTLVFQDTTGQPVRINRSSAVADSGNERTVGSHFGIYAKPVPGYINDVVVEPGMTSATISFTTVEPTISEILYGISTNLGTSSGATQIEETVHTRELTGLTPETGYYFQISAFSNDVPQLSPLYFFTTTNHTVTNLVFDLTNEWKYASTPLDGVNWMAESYDDAAWPAGPGLLWVDTRGTPNPDVEPRNTQMPEDTSFFPYITYYFRTHFDLGTITAGSSLLFDGFIDDGAVVYLNGVEIHRLRMPEIATSISLATGYPCDGDANCLDVFKLPFSALPSLKEVGNVLAVEVHNYNARSNDITFGLAVHRIDSVPETNPAKLNITLLSDNLEVSWDGSGGTLQSAPDPSGPWDDLEEYPGNNATIEPGEESRFYRLKR